MNKPRGMRLRIIVSFSNTGNIKWQFVTANGRQLEIDVEVNEKKIITQQGVLRARLDTFRDRLGGNLSLSTSKWDDISDAIKTLHTGGITFADHLFGKRWEEVRDLFNDLYPFWESDKEYPFLIELEAPTGKAIPIELLPVFRKQGPEDVKITNLDNLKRFARRFLGFSLFVRRTPTRKRIERNNILIRSPKLRIKFFHHAELPGARKELSFLKANEYMEVDGPWPAESFSDTQIVSTLADHLCDPTINFAVDMKTLPDQVQHFACHCETRDANSSSHSLILGHASKHDREVTIKRLQAQVSVSNGNPHPRRKGIKPLIFLNACGSAAGNERWDATFIKFFIDDNLNRGFIGTETEINDNFAEAFSKEFYTKLLEGYPLAEAFYLSRRELLERYKNPMGFLYTAYADPDIRIEPGSYDE